MLQKLSVLIALAVAFPHFGSAEAISVGGNGRFVVLADFSKSGKLRSCHAITANVENHIMTLTYTPDHKLFFSTGHVNGTKARGTDQVSIYIDRSKIMGGQVNPTKNNGSIAIKVNNPVPFLKAVRQGKALTVAKNASLENFDLTGSAESVATMLRCAVSGLTK